MRGPMGILRPCVVSVRPPAFWLVWLATWEPTHPTIYPFLVRWDVHCILGVEHGFGALWSGVVIGMSEMLMRVLVPECL